MVYNYKEADSRRIELYNLSGKMVKRMHSSGTTTRIETSSLANGLYILKVTDASGKTIRTEKIVLDK